MCLSENMCVFMCACGSMCGSVSKCVSEYVCVTNSNHNYNIQLYTNDINPVYKMTSQFKGNSW